MNHADPVAQAEIDRLESEVVSLHRLAQDSSRAAVAATLDRDRVAAELREIRRGLRSLDLEMKNLEVVCRRIEEIVDQILE